MRVASIVNVHQLAVGGLDENFSYVLFETESRSAAIVDPCGDAGMIRRQVEELGDVEPAYILLTHGHHDHTSEVEAVRGWFNAPVAAHPNCNYHPDLPLRNSRRLEFGSTFIECLHTPGHSQDSVVYRLGDDSALFTGDTLFVGFCGYCVAEPMFESLRGVIFPLADSHEVYAGHNYGAKPHAPLGELKTTNPYLRAADLETFREELKNL